MVACVVLASGQATFGQESGGECAPDPAGAGCLQTQCPVDGEFCLPRCINVDPLNGNVSVIDCDCQRTFECRPSPDVGPGQTSGFCVGDCPVGTSCREEVTVNADGSLDVCCDCVPIGQECLPAIDGFGCAPFDCPIAGQECVPVAVECLPGVGCRVLECDCRFTNECQIFPTAIPEQPFACDGDCPPGFVCEETIVDVDSDGMPELIRCDCVPEGEIECEPNAEGTQCRNAFCDIPEDRCVPQVVVCGPNGNCQITECDCSDPNRCHIDLDPPSFPFCTGECPDGFECVEREVALPNGFTQHKCDCVPETQACCTFEGCVELPPTACQEMGGTPLGDGTTCGPEGSCCIPGDATAFCIETDAQCCQVLGGTAQPSNEVCSATRACCLGDVCLDIDPACCDDFGGVTVFGTDCGPGVCDPPECGPTPNMDRCAPVDCPDENDVCVPTRVVCGPGDVPCRVETCECRDPNLCHVDLDPPFFPFCVGDCPDSTECVEREILLPTDETLHFCECLPLECEPFPDGSACAPFDCPDDNDECVPREAVCDLASGQCEITECDCGNPNGCQVVVVQGEGAFCEGDCPPGTVCEQFTTQLPGGQIRIKCECVPEICEPLPTGDRCAPTTCPDPGDECIPILLECLPGIGCRVIECECMSPNFCHIEINANGGPVCEGGCPGDDVCNLVGIDVDGDNEPDLFECRCSQPVACCLPDGDCAELDAVECDNAGGMPGPPGSVCDPPQPCCIVGAVIGECDERSPVCCELAGGIVQDAGDSCTERVACCLNDGPCLNIDPLCCDELGGTPGGPNSQCTLEGACCLPGGACEVLDRTCCQLAGGLFRGANTSCDEVSCPDPPKIVHELGLPGQTRPHTGYKDPKQDLNPAGNRDGLTSCEIRFNVQVFATNAGGFPTTANFSMTETGGGAPPTVTGVMMIGGDPTFYEVSWDRPLTLQEWTTIRASVFNAVGDPIINVGDLGPGMEEPDRVDLGYLPADVDQADPVAPLDLFRFRQYVNGIAMPPLGLVSDYIDTNRDGAVTPLDLFRYRQLVNGVATTQPWGGQSMNNPQP